MAFINCLNMKNKKAINKPKLSVSNYIKEKLKSTEGLPFETEIVHYKKNAFIKNTGEIEENIYFLISGIAEIGVYIKNKQNIVDFYFPGDFFCDSYSMVLGKPSNAYIFCITDCIIEKIPNKLLSKEYENSLITNRFIRHVLEVAAIRRILKEINMYRTVKERYLTLMVKRPEVTQNIPISKIAKYLGIDPNSLSRIRKFIR